MPKNPLKVPFGDPLNKLDTEIRIPLKPATHSGVILPPRHFMLRDLKESTQVAGMVQASGRSWRHWIARMDFPDSESRIA